MPAGRPRKYNYEDVQYEIAFAVRSENPAEPLTDQQISEIAVRGGIPCTAALVTKLRREMYAKASKRKITVPDEGKNNGRRKNQKSQ